jgi:hypothetical protein
VAGLRASPDSLDFGVVLNGNTAQLVVVITNSGPEAVTWDAAVFSSTGGPHGTNFDVSVPPFTNPIPPGGTVNYTFSFSPNANGPFSDTFTLYSTATNSPLVIPLAGTGGAVGFLTLTADGGPDFGSVKDGTPSAVKNVFASNVSGSDVTVTAIAFNGDFTAGPGQPGLPFTLHANNVDPPVAIPVIFTPGHTGFQVQANAVVVTNTATNSPTSQSLQGTGVIIFASFTVPPFPQAVLMAFVLPSGVVTILEMDEDDLDTEEPASLARVYDWGAPLMEKYLGRVILRYEDESAVPFAYTITGTAPRTPSPVVTNVAAQGGLNDGLIHNSFADLQISDDLVKVAVSRLANGGPIVITEIFHEVDKRGEVIAAA